jgi:transposase InsO family protein
MSKARLIITAVVVEKRAQAEVARAYGVSKGWVSKLVSRYRLEGAAAFEARSRRPKRSPTATDAPTIELICQLRGELAAQGLDAGADTIGWHLKERHGITLHRATIHRVLVRAGLITPTPKKRPRAAIKWFEAELANECWQSDFTHYRLANGDDVEILAWLDDCARYALRLTAHSRITGRIVLDEFRVAIAQHGIPASTLTDNGMVFTTRLSGGRGGRNAFEAELQRLGIQQKNSRPNHPTTCGKVERFHQTLKRWLAEQPAAGSITELQALLDTFSVIYNTKRPHRSLPHRATPAAVYTTRPKASPGDRDDTHYRVRRDTVDPGGTVTLRLHGRLHHIGLGRTHARTHVILLIDGDHVRVVHAATGELLRDLTIDTSRDYQPTHNPRGRPTK